MDTNETTSAQSASSQARWKTLAPFFAIIIIAAVAAGVYFYVNSKSEEPPVGDTSEEQTVDNEPNYTIEEAPYSLAEIAPNLDRGIQFGANIPENVRPLLSAEAISVQTRLKEDITRGDDWFDLGIVYYNANDFEGAKEVWEFLIQVAPENPTAFENLGRLYHFSLPDYPKSESYFKKAIEVAPDSVNAYLSLYELYQYSYKTDTAAAVDLMNQMIDRFPERLDLVLTLGVYYRDHGNYTKAREVLEEGLDQARNANNLDMIAAFGQEIERLP